MIPRLFKFLAVGASGTIIGLTILWLLTDLAGWFYLLSYVVAFIVSVTNNYLWNSLWTFKDKKANPVCFGKYLTLNIVTLCLNLTMVYIFTSIIGLWYILSALVTTIIVFVINFVVSQKYVWNKNVIN